MGTGVIIYARRKSATMSFASARYQLVKMRYFDCGLPAILEKGCALVAGERVQSGAKHVERASTDDDLLPSE
jgi:hypothetical protein